MDICPGFYANVALTPAPLLYLTTSATPPATPTTPVAFFPLAQNTFESIDVDSKFNRETASETTADIELDESDIDGPPTRPTSPESQAISNVLTACFGRQCTLSFNGIAHEHFADDLRRSHANVGEAVHTSSAEPEKVEGGSDCGPDESEDVWVEVEVPPAAESIVLNGEKGERILRMTSLARLNRIVSGLPRHTAGDSSMNEVLMTIRVVSTQDRIGDHSGTDADSDASNNGTVRLPSDPESSGTGPARQMNVFHLRHSRRYTHLGTLAQVSGRVLSKNRRKGAKISATSTSTAEKENVPPAKTLVDDDAGSYMLAER